MPTQYIHLQVEFEPLLFGGIIKANTLHLNIHRLLRLNTKLQVTDI